MTGERGATGTASVRFRQVAASSQEAGRASHMAPRESTLGSISSLQRLAGRNEVMAAVQYIFSEMAQFLKAIFTDPAWSVAIATWSLLLVTGIAAYIGLRAARAAANTFQLEAEPVVLVRQLEREEKPPHDPAQLLQSFTVTGTPLLADGVELRKWRDTDTSHANAQLALNKSVVLEIQNSGRSPALAVRIPFNVSVPVFLDERDPESGVPLVGTKEGSGYIVLAGIAPSSSVYVTVDNLLGNEATLVAHDFGDYIRIEGKAKKLRPLPIIALDHITIPGA